MKKLLLIIPILLLLAGCGPSKAELEAAAKQAVEQAQDTTITQEPGIVKITGIYQVMKPDGNGGGSIRFVDINEHRYIQWYSDNGASMCHDEECSNPKHTPIP